MAFLSVLFFLLPGPPALAGTREAPAVSHTTLFEKNTSPEVPLLFHATRYPFLPSLTKIHEPKLCSIVLKWARQRFFSPGIEISPPIDKEDGAEWIPWNVFQEVLFDRRVDLDLDGNGRLHPVIGKVSYGPGIMVDTRYRVFKSAKALEEKIAAADGNPDYLFENPFRLRNLGDMKIFRWKSRYYFFDYESENPYSNINVLAVSVFQLKGDGTVPLRCKVRITPDEPINPDLRAIPGFKSFLKVLSTIGKEDSSYRYAHHDSDANASVDRAAYRPWAVSRATLDPEALGGSYHRYDERMKSFLKDWSLLEVWNRREYQTFLHHVDPAVAALTKYYVDVFGIAREEANSAAEGVIEELIAEWILVPSSYNPDQDLYNIRRPPLNRPLFNRDRGALEEELRREKERRPDGSWDKNQPHYSDPFSPSSYNRKRPDIEISLALHVAVEWEEGMRLLLAAGADANAANEFGKTPLMTAAHMNRPDTIRLLLSHGADPNRKTGEMKYRKDYSPIRRTPLMYAAENAGTAVIKLLLDAGASPDERDSKGGGIGAYLARNPRLTDPEKKLDIRELVRSREEKPRKPNFDCSKARTSVDKLICDDEILNMFDGEMAIAYRRWKRLAGYEATKDQRRWLKGREASCVGNDKKSDIGCLQDQTRSRVRYLHNRLAEHEPETKKP